MIQPHPMGRLVLKYMESMDKKPLEDVEPIILGGGIGVLPTDTLYGVVGSALKKEAVERIYELRKRESGKPMIILIPSADALESFGIALGEAEKKKLSALWPGKVSVVLACPSEEFAYLHRGRDTLAFRVPAGRRLREFLKTVGPLVAPSANLAGEKPAATCAEAEGYFGGGVDFYVDAGRLESEPSTLVRMEKNGALAVLREGAVKIDDKAHEEEQRPESI